MFTEFSFACVHVLLQIRPVLYVVREEGDWTFTCGHGDHHAIDDWGRAHTHHFVDADRSLELLADLCAEQQAARYNTRSPWLRLIV